MNTPNGIFLEFERWLETVPKTGLLHIGDFSSDMFLRYKKVGFENINYIDKDDVEKFDDKSRIMIYLKNKPNALTGFNVLVVSSKDNEYDIISSGLPKRFDSVVIRYHRDSTIGKDILTEFMNYLKYDLKYTAEHKDNIITDLMFFRQK